MTVITPRTIFAASMKSPPISTHRQFTGHLMQECRIVEHFLDFICGAAVIEQRLHLVRAHAEHFSNGEQIIEAFRRVLAVVAEVGVFAPPVFERRFRREYACGDTSDAVDFQNFTLLWL